MYLLVRLVPQVTFVAADCTWLDPTTSLNGLRYKAAPPATSTAHAVHQLSWRLRCVVSEDITRNNHEEQLHMRYLGKAVVISLSQEWC